jgi:hypothetical protein
VVLEIEHGSRPQTRDRVDPKRLVVAHVTDVTARRAFARYHARTGRLCVRALPRVREVIVRAFGEVLASEPDAFRAEGLYDLAPFRDLASALATGGVERLVKVELHHIAVVTEDGLAMSFSRPRRDVLASAGASVIEASLAAGLPVSVRVYLHAVGRARPVRLELAADEKNNSVDFDREDADVAALVLAYMRARRILLTPASEDEEPAYAAFGTSA